MDDQDTKQAQPIKKSIYDVTVNVEKLNVRKDPSKDSDVVTIISNDGTVYTIVKEEIDDDEEIWGKLKSGIGWIMLRFTERSK